MASVYILFSEKLNKYYTGSCNHLQQRLGVNKNIIFKDAFIINSKDWSLYFCCNELEYTQARGIENHKNKISSADFY